ncbi:MAG: hypothetical protein AAFR18_12045 [Cyanobacteria bacterium J06627_32]
MAYFIVVWLGLLMSCLTVGCGLLHALQATCIRQRTYRIVLSAWLGLGVLSILLLAIALASPLTPWVGMGAIAAALLLCLSRRPVRAEIRLWASKISGQSLLVFGVCSGAISIFTTQRVTWIDTGLYHYGAIQWFATHGVTPGLALINRLFGFVSAWFALSAPFNPPQMQGRASALLNGFILLLLLLQTFLSGVLIKEQLSSYEPDVGEISSPIQASALFLLIFSLISFGLVTQTSFLSAIVVSASPDIGAILFTLISAWAMLVVSESGCAARSGGVRSLINSDLIPLVLSAAAVSIKLTTLPGLLVAISFYLFRQMTALRLLVGAFLSFGCLLPFLGAQTLISGCPLYPSTFACLNHLPWTLDVERVQDLASNTHGWAKWYGQPPTEANRQLWLILQWIGSNQSSKLMFVLLLISTVSGFYFLICHRDRTSYVSRLPLSGLYGLISLSWLGIAFIMLKAPLFRFGMGYLLLLPTLVLVIICQILFKKGIFRLKRRDSARRRPSVMMKLAFLSVALVTVISANADVLSREELADSARLLDRVLIASPLPTVDTQTRVLNGIHYIVTQHERSQCWSSVLPCVSLLNPDVKLRRPQVGVEGGFVHTARDVRS